MIIPAICLSYIAFTQDTLFLTGQRKVIAKVIEIETAKVKYRKFDNLDGPIYSLDKSEVLKINYRNGTTDSFSIALESEKVNTLTTGDFASLIKLPNLKVFVTATDTAAVIHAKRAIQNSLNWTIADNRTDCQLVVRFMFVSIGMGDKKGKAQFIDPANDSILFETKSVNTVFSWDMNTKRGVIDRIVNKTIKRLVED